MSYILAFLLGASMFCVALSAGAIEKGNLKEGLIMAIVGLVSMALLIKPINKEVKNEEEKRCNREQISEGCNKQQVE